MAVATVVADAFCHNMVRALVGALLAVGEGRRPPGWPAEVLAAAVRDPAVRVVPPHGLCLEEVGYPEPAGAGHTGRRDQEPQDRYGFPVSIRVLRLMLALPVTRLAANCSSCCRWADVDGDFRLVNSAHIKIR